MNPTPRLLKVVTPDKIETHRRHPVDDETLRVSSAIVEDVRREGEEAVRRYAERFGELEPRSTLVLSRDAMQGALRTLDPEDRAALERAAERIRDFAIAQRTALADVEIPVPGGRVGHTVVPVGSAGCYAPGGRYPLPSSVLMTAITARVAGCERVVVASPGAHPVTLAAAAIADADAFLAVGGAHAIGALAYGFQGFDPCDVIAGPGNRFVTGAKHAVSGVVGIDMLAGPSELLVFADGTADPSVVAADLIAQAEHDTDAVPCLVTTDPGLPARVEAFVEERLADLPTADVAREAFANGFACVVGGVEEALAVIDSVAPEHLELACADAPIVAERVRNAGAVFVGGGSPEVAGDYGVGPNHTLPTGGTARHSAGLSVYHFLRPRAWVRLDEPAGAAGIFQDTQRLALMEGLHGHARAAGARM